MRISRPLIRILLAITIIYQCTNSEPQASRLTGKVSRFLFGNIWKFNEYCGQNRTPAELVADDSNYQAFFNGSRLEAISALREPAQIQRGLNELVYTGIRARSWSSLICSVNSWGYADEQSFDASNTVKNNASASCWSALNHMLASVRTLSAGDAAAVAPGESDANRSELTADRDSIKGNRLPLKSWLQLNTFGRINQGYPYDSHFWLGDYTACKRLPSTRYCFGALRLRSWPAAAAGDDVRDGAFIRAGLCLPDSCNSKSFSSSPQQMHNLESMLSLYYNHGHRGHQNKSASSSSLYSLADVYCLPEDNSKQRQLLAGDPLSCLLLIASLAWIGALIYATASSSSARSHTTKQLADQSTATAPQQQQQQQLTTICSRILASFDIRRNMVKLFCTSTNRKQASGLDGLNFLKVLGIVWLMNSHILQLIVNHSINPQTVRQTGASSPLAMIILQGQHAVVIFFLISGLLAGRKHLNDDGSELSLARFALGRYARLAPMYLLTYAFVRKFAHQLGSGPLWDYGVSAQSEARQCMQESWLVPILMLANFIPPFAHCILTGWHIANDFQIFLLIPFLLKVYQRSRRAGMQLAGAAFATSHLYHMWNFHRDQSFQWDPMALEPFTIGTQVVLARLAYDYANPLGRVGTYFLGILLADLIFNSAGKSSTSSEGPVNDRTGTLKVTTSEQLEIEHRIPSGESSQQSKLGAATNWAKLDQAFRAHVGYLNVTSRERLIGELKDSLCLLVAMGLLIFCLISPALPKWITLLLNPYSKSISYPLLRLFNELCWFYILYRILRRQNPTGGISMASKQENNQTNSSAAASNWCSSKDRSIFATFLALPVWDLAAKLNYILVLTHFAIAKNLIQRQTHLIVFTWMNFFQITTFIIIIIYLIAIIVHIAIEIPLTSIVSEILGLASGTESIKRRATQTKEDDNKRDRA